MNLLRALLLQREGLLLGAAALCVLGGRDGGGLRPSFPVQLWAPSLLTLTSPLACGPVPGNLWTLSTVSAFWSSSQNASFSWPVSVMLRSKLCVYVHALVHAGLCSLVISLIDTCRVRVIGHFVLF